MTTVNVGQYQSIPADIGPPPATHSHSVTAVSLYPTQHACGRAENLDRLPLIYVLRWCAVSEAARTLILVNMTDWAVDKLDSFILYSSGVCMGYTKGVIHKCVTA